MAMRLFRVLRAGGVVALLMMLSGRPMGLGRLLVMFRRLVVILLSHVLGPSA